MKGLMDMGVSENHAMKALTGTKNGSMEECFQYIDAHENDVAFNTEIDPQTAESAAKKKKRKPRYIPLELQRLFSQLKLIDRQAVSTNALTTKGFEWQGMDGQVQHDAHELNRLLIDALDKSLKRTSGENLCAQLYEGRLANQIRCLTCGTVSEREEPFFDLNMQVTDCADLVHSLRQHSVAELLAGDSAYQCNACDARRSALRACVLRKLPPVLTFSCSRFRIDRSTNWQRVKVVTRSEFPLFLDMDLFAEGRAGVNDERCATAEDENKCLSELKGGMLWLEHACDNAKQIATQLVQSHGKDVTLESLSPSQQGEVASEMLVTRYLDGKGTKDSQVYQLHSVVMHRGSAHSGHYFAYIRDDLSEGHWTTPPPIVLSVATTASQKKNKTNEKKIESGNHAPLLTKINKIDTSALKSKPVSLSSASVTSHASASQVSEKTAEHYVVESASKVVYMADNSPLALIYRVLDEFTETEKKKARPKGNKAVPPARMQIGNLGRDLIKKLPAGGTWNSLHAAKLGSLQEYVQRHDQLFYVDATIKMVTVSFKMPRRIVKIVSAAQFATVQRTERSKTEGGAVSVESHPPHEEEEVSDSPLDEDEALARALQTSLDLEGVQVQLGGSSGEHSDWATATRKKPTKRDSKETEVPPAVSVPAVVEEVVEELSVEEKEMLLRDEAVDRVSNVLLNRFYGPFFEFNDSAITPMTLAGLERSFSGQDSAYLLVYRRCDVASLRKKLSAGLSSVAVEPVVPPPSYWADEVATMNDKLQSERLEYETSTNSVRLLVRCPAHVTYSSPFLLPVGGESFITLEISNRSTVSQVIEQFLAENSDRLGSMGLTSTAELVLSRLVQYGAEGFHVSSMPLEVTAVIGEALDNGALLCHPLLLWNGSSISGQSVATGFESLPKKLSVRRLGVDSSGQYAKSKAPRVAVTETLESFYVPYSTTVSGLCYLLASRLSIDPFSACVHFMEDAGRVRTGKSDGVLTSTLLFESGSVVEKLPVTAVVASTNKKNKGKGAAPTNTNTVAPTGRVLREDSLVGEVGDWMGDLLVEDRETRGLHASSLAELFAAQKNAEIVVTVELDLARDVDDVEESSKETAPSVVEVDINKSSTVLDLKRLALHRLGLSSERYLESTRLRTGMSRGESVLADETVVISSAASGVKSHSVVYLERGAKPAPDSITLNIRHVSGNSLAFQYEPSQCGTCVHEIELEVLLSESVRSLRDRLGVALCGYTEGWSGRDEDPRSVEQIEVKNEEDGEGEEDVFKGLRLRRTTWMKELADLLPEVGDKGSLPLTVGEAGLRGGDTLQLEDGRLPVKGQITLQIFVWRNDGHSRVEDVSATSSDCDLDLNPVEIASKRRLACLVRVGVLDCMEDGLLVDFQAQVLELLRLEAVRLMGCMNEWTEVPSSVDHFLLRELRPDMLPGRSFWTCAAPAVAQDLNSIGSRNPGSFGKGAGPKGGVSAVGSLKRLQLKDRNLVVEMLTDVQARVRPSAGAFRVWVQQLLNPGADEGCAIMSPMWPPRQVLVSGGVAPSMMHLKRPVCTEFKDIALDRAVIFKFQTVGTKWTEMCAGEGKKKSKGASASKENILQPPYSLKEGDQLCVFQSHSVSNAFGTASANSTPDGSSYRTHPIALPEDLFLRAMKQEARKERSSGGKRSKGDAKQKVRVEVSLSLGSNFDFSDEEEDL
eukprot:gene22855-29029_t